MKRNIMFLLGLVSCMTLFAEKLEDRYITQPVQAGLLYFIKPFEVPSASKLPAAEYDITYILTSDSLILNMTLRLPEAVSADSIVFHSAENMSVRDFKTFFIDKEKKHYRHRYSCTLPYAALEKVYRHPSPYTMTLYAGTMRFEYGYSASSWTKECSWMNQILSLINTNRQIQSLKQQE